VSRTGVEASAGLRVDVGVGDDLGAAAFAGTSEGVPVLTGSESGNSVRGALGEGIDASTGRRVEIEAEDELGAVA
jgi:hypothetical protein